MWEAVGRERGVPTMLPEEHSRLRLLLFAAFLRMTIGPDHDHDYYALSLAARRTAADEYISNITL